MKRAIYISILCTVMLTACGNVSESTKSAETSDVSQTAVTVTSAKEEMDTSEATTTTKKSSQTVSSSSKPTGITVTTTKKSGSSGASGNSIQGQNNSVQNNNGQENNVHTREKILRKAAEMGYKQFAYLPLFLEDAAKTAESSILPSDKREIAMLTTQFLSNSHFSSMMLDRFQAEIDHLHSGMTIHRISPIELKEKKLPSSLNIQRTQGLLE